MKPEDTHTHTHTRTHSRRSEDKVLWLIGWYFRLPPDVAPRSLNALFVSAAARVFFSTNPLIHELLPDSAHLHLPDGWRAGGAGGGGGGASGPQDPVSTLIQAAD